MAQLTFCQRIKRRNARRRAMLAMARQNATDDTGRRLAERLAVAWRVKGDKNEQATDIFNMAIFASGAQ